MAGRTGFFPTPFPGEILYSLCARYHRLSANSNIRTTQSEISCTKEFFGFSDIPAGTECLLTNTALGTAIGLDHLIQHNTSFPYYFPYLNSVQIEKCRQRLCTTDTTKSLGFAIGLKYQLRGKYCSRCIEEDKLNTGQSYWHLSHQLPGVLICPLHRVPLRIAEQTWLKRSLPSLILPDSPSVESHSWIPDLQRINALLDEISLISAKSLTSSTPLSIPAFLDYNSINQKNLWDASKLIGSLPRLGEYESLSLTTMGYLSKSIFGLLHRDHLYHRPLEYILLTAVARLM
ncbi:TniQ family protein [Metapseudomonas resinovorans]|uniref:TniQ family protein n=1 Tax=Metapseudomonas resinovorans TaxID=53412 RepID=UPI0009DC3B70